MIKTFGKFSFEPTFYPVIDIPKEDITGGKYYNYSDIYNAYNECFIERNKIKTLGRDMKMYDDQGCLEVASGIQTDYLKFRSKYIQLVDKLRGKGYVPSSEQCLESEGGCHINMDLSHIENDKRLRFIECLRDFLLQNYSIIWMFLSPYDNASSKIFFKSKVTEYEKGMMLTVKHDYTYIGRNMYGIHLYNNIYNYVELRFFMMPRTLEEFDLHFEFANKLLFYIQSIYDRDCNFKSFDKSVIVKSKYKQVVDNFKEVCNLIDFDFNKIKQTDKLELLKWRFELGPKYLV